MPESSKINLFLNFAKEEMKSYDESHNLDHISRVVNNALEIGISLGLNVIQLELLEICAILHDVLDHKYTPKNSELETFGNSKKDRLVRLLKNEFQDEYRGVLYVIENCSFSKEVKGLRYICPYSEDSFWKLLLDIVSDADRIDALGEQGLERCFQYVMASKKVNREEAVPFVLKHIEEKLSILIDYIYTEKGKEMAKEGDLYIRRYYQKVRKLT